MPVFMSPQATLGWSSWAAHPPLTGCVSLTTICPCPVTTLNLLVRDDFNFVINQVFINVLIRGRPINRKGRLIRAVFITIGNRYFGVPIF
jgi:hypothetical protein